MDWVGFLLFISRSSNAQILDTAEHELHKSATSRSYLHRLMRGRVIHLKAPLKLHALDENKDPPFYQSNIRLMLKPNSHL